MIRVCHIRRAAIGMAALAAFAAACTWAGRAQAQDVSPLAFVRSEAAAPAAAKAKPQTRRGTQRGARFVTTARWVDMPLPPPPPFIRGRLVCAENVNAYRRKMGLSTTGSRAAMSFRSLRPATRWTRGAVQVSSRKGGGHAEIVVGDGTCMHPSSSQQRWVRVSCSVRRNVIGWYV